MPSFPARQMRNMVKIVICCGVKMDEQEELRSSFGYTWVFELLEPIRERDSLRPRAGPTPHNVMEREWQARDKERLRRPRPPTALAREKFRGLAPRVYGRYVTFQRTLESQLLRHIPQRSEH